MKRLSLSLTLAALMMTACADQGRQAVLNNLNGADGVIYGQDSVRNITEQKIHGSVLFKQNLRASAALVNSSELSENPDGSALLNDKTVEEKYRTCSDFNMSEQMSAAFCSGILVAPNVVLTAAHCLSEEEGNSCESTNVVFGYSAELNLSVEKKVEKNQIYHCKKVLQIDNYSNNSDVDYALIELDRKVEGIEAVKLPKNPSAIQLGDEIYTVGYPVGTPKKIARGQIRRLFQDHNNPQASLDVYYGNSGSPIFNTLTNELVGILSNGEDDFVTTKQQCQEPKKCSDNNCLGEAIVPLSKIAKKINKNIL